MDLGVLYGASMTSSNRRVCVTFSYEKMRGVDKAAAGSREF
jgi:hypothetical protein